MANLIVTNMQLFKTAGMTILSLFSDWNANCQQICILNEAKSGIYAISFTDFSDIVH